MTATPLSELRPAAGPENGRTASGAEGDAEPTAPGKQVSDEAAPDTETGPVGSGSAHPAADAAPAKPDSRPEAASGAKPDTAPEAAPARPVGDQAASGPDLEVVSGRSADGAPAGSVGSEGGSARPEPDAASGSVAGAKPDSATATSAGGSGSGRPADAAPAGPGADSRAKPDSAPEADAAPAERETDSGRKPGVAASARTGGGSGVNFRRPAGTAPGGQTDTESSASRSDAAPARPAGGQTSPAEPEGASGQKPDTAAAAAGVTSAKSQTAPEATPGRAAAGDAAPAPATAPGAVDRQTAVFKALKRPGVDQPTAMLKLPPQPPAPASELPAERTSKFVPLRSEQAAQPAVGVAEAERTRQQPMPPLPPLDLLAELTNKPAPPETPTRTVVRRVKIWTPLLVLVLIIFAVVQAVRPLPAPSLNLTAKSTYTFEGDKPSLPWPGEGQGFMAATGLGTVDSFGEQKAVPIGSVAKAMTAYVVLKDKPLAKGADGPSITVDAKAEEDGGLDAQGESTLNTVKEGDKLTQHDALAALMIPSANNIARLLARWNADGSEEAFVKKMNDTAEELGMKNTTYTDPSGLDATTVSSAEDQVKLGQKLVEIEALMDITKLPEWEDPSGKIWRNYNTLVPYDGALGIKTGSTTKAGGNLLFAAHKTVGDTDQLIVGAVLGQHKAPIIDTVNAVSKDVMLATQDELEGATIVKKGQVVGEFDNGMGTTAPVVATEDVKAVGWSGLTVKLELSDEGKDLPQSAAAGTHVGLLTVGEGKSRVEVAVALQGDLAEPTFGDKLTRVG
ncbi:hypothetical protein ABZ353_21410 [Streptomyces niveus]|uniref:D-alanyl-D-alanine carboxypeptidase family protein n=1 Tax=Streptomyces niveus TaxID=193462 RepID=UPI0033F5D61B